MHEGDDVSNLFDWKIEAASLDSVDIQKTIVKFEKQGWTYQEIKPGETETSVWLVFRRPKGSVTPPE